MGKNIGKNISKNLSSKYSQNFLIMLNNLSQAHLKLLQKKQLKRNEETDDDLIGNKFADEFSSLKTLTAN